MAATGRQFKRMLSDLGSEFVSRGWTIDACDTHALRLSRVPGPGVEHEISLFEPSTLAPPPPPGHRYLECRIFVLFPEVERLINLALDREQVSMNMVSWDAGLARLVPGHTLAPGEHHAVAIEPGASTAGKGRLLADHDRYAVPLLAAISDESVLRDAGFCPPEGSYFTWALRRIAHARLHAAPDEWTRLADALEKQSRDVLDAVEPPALEQAGIFTNIQQLKRASMRSGPETVVRLIAARKASATRRAACSCGQLSALVSGDPLRVSICHCLHCQRRSGSVFAAQARFWREQVVVSGASASFALVGDEGSRARFHFCPTCGVTVYFQTEGAEETIAIPIGAFADPLFPAPTVSVYEERKHTWVVPPPGAEHIR